MKTILPALLLASILTATALDLETAEGKTYRDVKAARAVGDELEFSHSAGTARVSVLLLPEDFRRNYWSDSQCIAASNRNPSVAQRATTYWMAKASADSAAGKKVAFRVAAIRFDESTGSIKPTPQIPKGWKLVSVSNGEKQNSNNLWFQDGDGSVYLMQGFTTGGQFILQQSIQKLDAAP